MRFQSASRWRPASLLFGGALAALVAYGVVAFSTHFTAAEKDLYKVDADDPAMARAVREARATFADFLSKVAAPPAGTHDYTVKVDLSGGTGRTEFVWLMPFVLRGRDVVGAIANTPEIRTEFKQGQVIAVARDDVVDWSYRDGGKRRGNFTACVLLTHEPAAERAATIRDLGLDC